jgi:hypothetical protein
MVRALVGGTATIEQNISSSRVTSTVLCGPTPAHGAEVQDMPLAAA